MTEELDICLLVDGPHLAQWQATALSELLEETDASLTTVVYNQHTPERSIPELLRRAVELREWSVVAMLFRLVTRTPTQSESVLLKEIFDLNNVEEYHVHPEIIDGWKQKIPKETVETIAEQSDLAVRFGFGFLVGSILQELEHGVLSYHHGDIREYRGQPMGFWEYINGEEEGGITVQILNEELDAGNVAALKRVSIKDLHTWQSVRARLTYESHDMLRRAVENIESNDVKTPESLGNVYTHPKGRPVVKYTMKNSVGMLREWLNKYQ